MVRDLETSSLITTDSLSSSHLAAPLLDRRHLHLGDGVVSRMEPFGQPLEDVEGGDDGDVPGVDQLRAAVVRGDDLPVIHLVSALGADPVSAQQSEDRSSTPSTRTPQHRSTLYFFALQYSTVEYSIVQYNTVK